MRYPSISFSFPRWPGEKHNPFQVDRSFQTGRLPGCYGIRDDDVPGQRSHDVAGRIHGGYNIIVQLVPCNVLIRITSRGRW